MESKEKIYLSSKELDIKKVIQLFKKSGLLGNIMPIVSVIDKNKPDEQGVKIEVFNRSNDKLKSFWLECRSELGINCFWIDLKGFSGCITKYKPFKSMDIKCSMYK